MPTAVCHTDQLGDKHLVRSMIRRYDRVPFPLLLNASNRSEPSSTFHREITSSPRPTDTSVPSTLESRRNSTLGPLSSMRDKLLEDRETGEGRTRIACLCNERAGKKETVGEENAVSPVPGSL